MSTEGSFPTSNSNRNKENSFENQKYLLEQTLQINNKWNKPFENYYFPKINQQENLHTWSCFENIKKKNYNFSIDKSKNQIKTILDNKKFIGKNAFKYTTYFEKQIPNKNYLDNVIANPKTKAFTKRRTKSTPMAFSNDRNHLFFNTTTMPKTYESIKTNEQSSGFNNLVINENLFLTENFIDSCIKESQQIEKELILKKEIFNYEDENIYNRLNIVALGHKDINNENYKKAQDDPDFLQKLSRPVITKAKEKYMNFVTNKSVKKGLLKNNNFTKLHVGQIKKFEIKDLKDLHLIENKKDNFETITHDTVPILLSNGDSLTKNLNKVKEIVTSQNIYRNKINLENLLEKNLSQNLVTEITNTEDYDNKTFYKTDKNFTNTKITSESQINNMNINTQIYFAKNLFKDNIISNENNNEIAKMLKTFTNSTSNYDCFNPFKNHTLMKFYKIAKVVNMNVHQRIKSESEDILKNQRNQIKLNLDFREKTENKTPNKLLTNLTTKETTKTKQKPFIQRIFGQKGLMHDEKQSHTEEDKLKAKNQRKLSLMNCNVDFARFLGKSKKSINKQSEKKYLRVKEKKVKDFLSKIIDKTDLEIKFGL